MLLRAGVNQSQRPCTEKGMETNIQHNQQMRHVVPKTSTLCLHGMCLQTAAAGDARIIAACTMMGSRLEDEARTSICS